VELLFLDEQQDFELLSQEDLLLLEEQQDFWFLSQDLTSFFISFLFWQPHVLQAKADDTPKIKIKLNKLIIIFFMIYFFNIQI
tara:strand:- start:13861 stop:14109 length:249 start_codon:yes stop_codon:yes gene_type:complete